MLAIIALNIVFAAVVAGAVVGLLGRSISASRAVVPVQPARSHARARTARRRLATVTG